MRGAVFLAVMVAAATAFAQAPDADDDVLAQAKAHFAAGRAAYEAGDYKGAIKEFEEAETLRSSPMLAYNMGLAWEQLGEAGRALAQYRRYLEEKPDAANREEVEKRIATLAPPKPPTVTGSAVERPPDRPPPRVSCIWGQVATEDTDGHCCWPRQVWSKQRQICAGIPACPSGLVAVGEGCVRGAPLPPLAEDPWSALPPAHVMPRSAPSGMVPVRFLAKRAGYQYGVTVGKKTCGTPCELFVKPGEHTLKITGAATYATKVKLPETSSIVIVQHRRLGYFITGAIFTGLGSVAAIAGTALLATGTPWDTNWSGGVIAMLVGAVFLPIGIPLMAKVDSDKVQLSSSGLSISGLGVAPTRGGATAALTLSF
jgi:hypothetical protein